MYTQRYQDRLQRVARETTKREAVYADFIMSASNLLLNARVHDEITLGGDTQHLIGLANRMRLFAPPNIIDEAEVVIKGLIEISLKPSVDLRKLAMAELSKNPIPISFSHSVQLAGRTRMTCTGPSTELEEG